MENPSNLCSILLTAENPTDRQNRGQRVRAAREDASRPREGHGAVRPLSSLPTAHQHNLRSAIRLLIG